MTLRKALAALNELVDAPPSHTHFAQWQRETSAEKNDRGAAILLATNVENALQGAITQIIEIEKGQHNKLFGLNAPLGSFANMITMAHAMRVFGNETRSNLDVIRRVRNAFAHAKLPIDFETPQIARACEFLKIPTLLPPHAVQKDHGKSQIGRKRFQTVCNATAHNLLMFSMSRKVSVDSAWLKVDLPPRSQVVMVPLPCREVPRRRALPDQSGSPKRDHSKS
jgi:hypothetical protein